MPASKQAEGANATGSRFQWASALTLALFRGTTRYLPSDPTRDTHALHTCKYDIDYKRCMLMIELSDTECQDPKADPLGGVIVGMRFQFPGVDDLAKVDVSWNKTMSSVMCILIDPVESSGMARTLSSKISLLSMVLTMLSVDFYLNVGCEHDYFNYMASSLDSDSDYDDYNNYNYYLVPMNAV